MPIVKKGEYQPPAIFAFGRDHTVLYACYGQENTDIPENEALLQIIANSGA
jgi:hypothetical protein